MELDNAQILLDIQKQIGEVSTQLAEIKTLGIATHEHAEKTNGRVTKLESVTVPDILKEVNTKSNTFECEKHKETLLAAETLIKDQINYVDKKTKPFQWMVEKPIRIISFIAFVVFVNRIIPEFTFIEFINFIKTIL